jgi:hypothetical protein
MSSKAAGTGSVKRGQVAQLTDLKWKLDSANRSINWPVTIADRAFFNYITTGAFTPVGPLLAPVVKQDFQTNWALLIISK